MLIYRVNNAICIITQKVNNANTTICPLSFEELTETLSRYIVLDNSFSDCISDICFIILRY